MPPHLTRIDLFPVKSLDGVRVPKVTVLNSGALERDRTFALFDAKNRFINGKRNAAIHRLRATFSTDLQAMAIRVDGNEAEHTFHLQTDRSALNAWLSDYFQQPVTVQANDTEGFPDDTEAAGPTVISTATLEAVAAWYPDLTVAEVRRRLRTNLEIGGVPAFWEDQLFGPGATPVSFAIGDVVFDGINPCQRCVVPTRDARTGEVSPNFQRVFTQQRQTTLPPWTHRDRFNHFYRLAVNTNIRNQGGKVLRVGDAVK
ncbi:MOSC N-terminal beta barrel domain-containing protein [Nodosilinea sp. P-1105]|uniref:MOSC domain-containing protein n=1 Tax=Nodosilinea sp. P-1105 TaxID=2546229 RepID=UPI00146CBB20|nr:MOSC N-terminal beta barrel domain-containing protein [Nodosilinea sp. P-1105]NMF83346.1 MOSC domain-containing protein [Nodosilinea sp. P-1105]